MSLWPGPPPDDRLRDLAAARRDYRVPPLRRADLPAAPGPAFAAWYGDAAAGGVLEPNAMVLATVGEDGVPAARTVLLKGASARGFSFFTNYQSRKGRQLAAHPHATALFVWLPLSRQVAVTGPVARLPSAESDEYFASRPRASQIAAWASPQSQRISGREELHRSWQQLEERFAEGDVPRPPHWGGFEVRPVRLEFWQGQPSRMHDRIVYTSNRGEPADLTDPASWERSRLAP
jgi:pyridoxamine 5'-phosphate oxidase